MRSLLVILGLLLGVPLAAQTRQADDERPGARCAPAPQAPTDSDTPPQNDARPAEQGDSPLHLTGSGNASAVEGRYAGVTIGGEGLPPHPPKLPVKGPQRMTWPGFQVRDGVPTVFLQTTGTPNYSVTEGPGAIKVTLRGTRIQLRNNRRPLKVAAFGTPITEVSAQPRGHDVVVTIKHKGETGHRERVEPSAGGFQLLVVELPKK